MSRKETMLEHSPMQPLMRYSSRRLVQLRRMQGRRLLHRDWCFLKVVEWKLHWKLIFASASLFPLFQTLNNRWICPWDTGHSTVSYPGGRLHISIPSSCWLKKQGQQILRKVQNWHLCLFTLWGSHFKRNMLGFFAPFLLTKGALCHSNLPPNPLVVWQTCTSSDAYGLRPKRDAGQSICVLTLTFYKNLHIQ